VTGTIIGGWTKLEGGVGGGSVPAGVCSVIGVEVDVVVNSGTLEDVLVGVRGGSVRMGGRVGVWEGLERVGVGGTSVSVGVSVSEAVGVNEAVRVGVWEGDLVPVGVDVAVEVVVKVGVEVSEGGISVRVGVGESVGRIERCTRRPMLIDPLPVTQKCA